MWQVLVVPSSQPRNNAYVIVPLHSGPILGFLSNGYIITYFLKFLKNIFMLTKIFEETLPWLVKILKTDQQWRSLRTNIPISMDLLRPQCNTRRPQCRYSFTLILHCWLSSSHMEIWVISYFQCCQHSSNTVSWQYVWSAISYKVPWIQ